LSLLALFDESERFFSLVQKHMLDGLLGEDATSTRALRAWAAKVDIDDIDAASYRLIPALYARAGADPVLHALHRRMKGIYRYYFYRNNRFLFRIEHVLSVLTSAGIDFILFKGISILLQYHNSSAVRSSGDCDILVHPRDKVRAETVLADCGLVYRYDAERKLRDRHSHDFIDEVENGFDLHWYALLECCEESIDDGFWRRSRYIVWKGLRLRVLAPEDELLVAGMNGIREIENARADWLYDAWTILKAVPNLDWHLLHEELRRRRLQDPFLKAISQLHRFVPHFPEVVVKREFSDEIKYAAWQVVAENRTFALDPKTDRDLTALLAPSSIFRRFAGAIRGTDWRARIARSGDVARYIRYDVHEDGSVSRVYLHRDAQVFLGEIFDVADSAALQTANNLASHRDEVRFDLAPGVLRVPRQARPRQYAATVAIKCRLLRFSSPDIASLRIEVRVTNDSTWPWHVFAEREGPLARQDSNFGLSYHLFTESRDIVSWDLPRVYFLVSRPGQVAMLLPGDSIRLELEILRPPAPGQFEARIDVVQERVTWFDPEGIYFPRLPIEVL
jgi:hypothetical protein